MAQVTIQKVGTNEVQQLQSIGRGTFLEAFGAVNTAADMQAYLEKSFAAEVLAQELADPNMHYYFASHADEVLGYLKLNTGDTQTELKDQNAVEIERIYLLNKAQGMGMGQHLLDFAVRFAIDRNADFLWLGVWEKNAGAIRFYKRNGFTEFSRHTFLLGSDLQLDLMMKRSLKSV